MVILGLSDGAEPGAALVVDDHVVGVALERMQTKTPTMGQMPWASVDHLLQQARLTPSDVDQVAVAGRFTPPLFVRRRPSVRTQFHDPFSALGDASVLWQAVLRRTGFGAMEAEQAAALIDRRLIAKGFPIRSGDHDRCAPRARGRRVPMPRRRPCAGGHVASAR